MTWKTFGNGTRHIHTKCRQCGAFIRWAEQTPENIERADAAVAIEPPLPDLFS
jgi:hypothetical protein